MGEPSRSHAWTAGSVVTLRGIVRDVVTEIAPEELPFVEAMSGLSDAQVSRRLTRGKKRRDPLGFGTAEVVVLVTPIAWMALQEVVNRGTDGLLRRTGLALRRLLRRPEPSVPVPGFDDLQKDEVRHVVLRTAQDAGLPPERAGLLADAVVGRLPSAK